MREHKKRMLTVGVLVAALGLGACGGDDERPLTKAEYIERGSAICTEGSQKIEAGAKATFSQQGSIPPVEEIRQFADEIVAPTIENEVERLRELGPPEADEERIEDILQAGSDGVDTVREDATILLSRTDDGFNTYRELSSAYGLQNCGGGTEATRDAISGIVRDGA